MTTAFPLQWPDGWPRTSPSDRVVGKHRFKRPDRSYQYAWSKPWTFAAAQDALLEELRKLGASDVVISSNFKVGRDGPIEGSRRPDDQGIAVYFLLNGERKSMARDPFIEAEANMRTLALAIAAMRQLELHGGDYMMERAFAGFAAIASPRSCWETLGLRPGASEVEVERAYRDKAKTAHPDVGGSDAAMAELNRAREEAPRQVACPVDHVLLAIAHAHIACGVLRSEITGAPIAPDKILGGRSSAGTISECVIRWRATSSETSVALKAA